jgi:hypothetical protein
MHMAMTGLFRAKWSDSLHEESMTQLLEKTDVLGNSSAYRDIVDVKESAVPHDRHDRPAR